MNISYEFACWLGKYLKENNVELNADILCVEQLYIDAVTKWMNLPFDKKRFEKKREEIGHGNYITSFRTLWLNFGRRTGKSTLIKFMTETSPKIVSINGRDNPKNIEKLFRGKLQPPTALIIDDYLGRIDKLFTYIPLNIQTMIVT